jgi:hypothetical protein
MPILAMALQSENLFGGQESGQVCDLIGGEKAVLFNSILIGKSLDLSR